MPVMFGLVIAYLLSPVLDYLEIRIVIPLCDKIHLKKSKRREGFTRLFCILVTLTLFFLLIYELIYMLIAKIVPSVISIANNFDVYVDNITNWLNKILEDNPIIRDNAMNLILT